MTGILKFRSTNLKLIALRFAYLVFPFFWGHVPEKNCWIYIVPFVIRHIRKNLIPKYFIYLYHSSFIGWPFYFFRHFIKLWIKYNSDTFLFKLCRLHWLVWTMNTFEIVAAYLPLTIVVLNRQFFMTLNWKKVWNFLIGNRETLRLFPELISSTAKQPNVAISWDKNAT